MPRPHPASIPGHPRWAWKGNRWALGAFSIRSARTGGYDLVRAGNPPVLWGPAPYLTPQLAAAAGEQALVGGRAASSRRLDSRARGKARTAELVDSGQCEDRDGSPVYYHVTRASLLPSIRKHGLVPYGREPLRSHPTHSGPDSEMGRRVRGKLFLAIGADAVTVWAAATWMMVQFLRRKGEAPENESVVSLRVDKEFARKLRPEYDSWGAVLTECSSFVRRKIPAKHLLIRDRRNRWVPLAQSTGRAARRLRGESYLLDQGAEPVLVAAGQLVHARVLPAERRHFPRFLRLRPRIPMEPMPDEDTTIRRVSLSRSPSGALAALRIDSLQRRQWPDWSKRQATIGIWSTTTAVDAWRPGRDLVPDALITGEHWSLDPVPVQLLDVLRPDTVEELSGQMYEASRGARDGYDAWDEDGDDEERLWLLEAEAIQVTAADWLQDVVAKTHAGVRAWLDAGNSL